MKPFLKYSKGQIAVMMTLVIGVLLGAMALGTDVAVMYLNWTQIRKAADSAVLAGAGYLSGAGAPSYMTLSAPSASQGCSYATNSQTAACNYALQNGVKSGEIQSITTGTASDGTPTIQMVVLRSDIPSFFLRVLPNAPNTFSASVVAMAEGAQSVGSVKNGLFPAGMPSNPNGQALTYGTQFALTDLYSPGNWGWLDVPDGLSGSTTAATASTGGGAQQLLTNIQDGCTCQVSVGDWLYTKPGQSWGPVQSAVNTRANGDTLPAQGDLTGNEPQLVTVPIIDWSAQAPNGSSGAVQIQGFAEVWLDGIQKQGQNEILTVQFVQYVSNYAVAGGGPDFGAYTRPTLIQ